jgi:methyl-accepting chemotaxis protein
MDQATQQNAALVEQSAAAAESLRHQAQQLVEAVAVFRLGADASGGHHLAGSTSTLATRATPTAATAAGGYAGAERRGPARATNVTRPAFGGARPGQASGGGGASASAPDHSSSSAAAPARTGTDDWESF